MSDEVLDENKKGKMSKKSLLHDLIWPAVAGNVAWAFFSVLITEVLIAKENIIPLVFGRVAALLLLSVYLLIIYIRSAAGTGHIFDMLHAISIILCAISFQSPAVCVGLMTTFLITLFIIAALGHWTGRWIPNSVTKKTGLKKFKVGLINFSGAILCFILPKWIGNDNNYNLSASMGVVLILWLIFRNKIYKDPT